MINFDWNEVQMKEIKILCVHFDCNLCSIDIILIVKQLWKDSAYIWIGVSLKFHFPLFFFVCDIIFLGQIYDWFDGFMFFGMVDMSNWHDNADGWASAS